MTNTKKILIVDDDDTLRETLKELASKRAYGFIVAGVTLISFTSYGAQAFTASFFAFAATNPPDKGVNPLNVGRHCPHQ